MNLTDESISQVDPLPRWFLMVLSLMEVLHVYIKSAHSGQRRELPLI